VKTFQSLAPILFSSPDEMSQHIRRNRLHEVSPPIEVCSTGCTSKHIESDVRLGDITSSEMVDLKESQDELHDFVNALKIDANSCNDESQYKAVLCNTKMGLTEILSTLNGPISGYWGLGTASVTKIALQPSDPLIGQKACGLKPVYVLFCSVGPGACGAWTTGAAAYIWRCLCVTFHVVVVIGFVLLSSEGGF